MEGRTGYMYGRTGRDFMDEMTYHDFVTAVTNSADRLSGVKANPQGNCRALQKMVTSALNDIADARKVRSGLEVTASVANSCVPLKMRDRMFRILVFTKMTVDACGTKYFMDSLYAARISLKVVGGYIVKASTEMHLLDDTGLWNAEDSKSRPSPSLAEAAEAIYLFRDGERLVNEDRQRREILGLGDERYPDDSQVLSFRNANDRQLYQLMTSHLAEEKAPQHNDITLGRLAKFICLNPDFVCDGHVTGPNRLDCGVSIDCVHQKEYARASDSELAAFVKMFSETDSFTFDREENTYYASW